MDIQRDAGSHAARFRPGQQVTASVRKLRELLEAPGCHHFPTCYDSLSARLVQRAGFPLTFTSGSWVSATRLGSPDTGLITMTEMADQLRYICSAVPGLPVLADGDTGYGNAMNARRAVTEFARAGAAAIMIEDQVEPKRCGHFDGKAVVSRAEARMKVRAAVEAARENGILIVARTDSRAVDGFAAAMDRCMDFAAEGADIIFLEAPESIDEMRIFAKETPRATLANIIPGGKSPVPPRQQLEDLGFKLAVYHPLIFASVRAIQEALTLMQTESTPAPLPLSFEEMKRIVGLPEYDAQALRYKT